MRMVFLDESGTGKIEYEPNFVLAGVIVHADKQWKAVENHLVALMAKYSPLPWNDLPADYCFHASELYSGGKIFTRNGYPREKRWEVLDELCAIPAKFDLPIVGHYIEREVARTTLEAYRACYTEAAASVEAYMRLLPDRDEVASIICEDLKEVRQWVQDMHRFQQHNIEAADHLHAHDRDRLRLTRVVGQPHFEGKGPYMLLQVADVCAFVCAAKLAKKPSCDRFFEPLAPMLLGRKNNFKPGASGLERSRF